MIYQTRKQIIIGAFYILLFVLVGAGIYYSVAYQTPSCFDNIKNQDEENVDCGGSCAQGCIPLFDVEVISADALPLGGGYYDLVGKIRNPNPNFGVPVLRYRFELKDADGNIAAQKEGATFLLPNSPKYLIENNFQTSAKIASATLKIEPLNKSNIRLLDDYKPVELFIKDRRFEIFSQPGLAAQATGVAQNKTAYDFEKVNVNIILFDDNKTIVGAAKSEIKTLTAGEERYFSARWIAPLRSSGVITPDMTIETDLFSDANFIRIYGAPSEP